MKKDFQYLLEAISTDIIGWLMVDNGISLSEAINTWFNSETFEKNVKLMKDAGIGYGRLVIN